MFARLKFSHITTGLITVLVGYASSVAIIFQAIDTLSLPQAQANSWMLALGLGMGVSTIFLSLYHKMPILTAWSTPGAALLVVSLKDIPLSAAIGAFLLCGILLILTGITGWFDKITRLIPDAIANAMLAGILFQFTIGIFTQLEGNIPLVATMFAVYLLTTRYFPLYVIPSVLISSILLCWGLGLILPGNGFELAFSPPVFVMPTFTVSAALGVGVPLYIVTMTSQNMPGIIALRTAGYMPPISSSIIVTGLTTLVLAPFGGYTFNLAAITAAICCEEAADPDPKTRYMASIIAGVLYIMVGLLGGAVIGLFLIIPKAMIVTLAGLALLGTVANSLSAALVESSQRTAGLVTFLTTVSGISFMSIGAPVWGLLFGMLVHFITSQKAG